MEYWAYIIDNNEYNGYKKAFLKLCHKMCANMFMKGLEK